MPMVVAAFDAEMRVRRSSLVCMMSYEGPAAPQQADRVVVVVNRRCINRENQNAIESMRTVITEEKQTVDGCLCGKRCSGDDETGPEDPQEV
jgi:hypothetical protein